MSTRLKKPPFWRHLALTVALLGFQGYLGYSTINGQLGIESQRELQHDIKELQARSDVLQIQIDSYRHRVDLFNSSRLDPDILTEKARALLSMAKPDEIVIMRDLQSR